MDEIKKLQELQDNVQKLERFGCDLQKAGQQIVSEAKDCNEYLDFLKQEYPKQAKVCQEYKSNVNIKQWVDYEKNKVESIISSAMSQIEKIEEIVFDLSTTTTSASATSNFMAITIDIIQYNNPTIDFYKNYDLKKPPRKKKIQEELDFYLTKINPNLPTRRKGAWETFHSPGSDQLSQAAHTMRDIFAKIITEFASNDTVEKAKWWQPDIDAKDRVSLRQRIRFLIYGEEEATNKEELESMMQKVKECLHADRSLKEVAHGRKGAKDLIESYLFLIEAVMLEILKNREKYKA